jgi:hypothetical protein
VTPVKIGKVLNEYHKDGELNGFFAGGRWVYDFPALLRQHLPKADVRNTRSAFTGGAWDEYGRLIEVNL